MTDKENKFNFTEALKELEKINEWFQSDDINLDEGLDKLKQGNELIKACRLKLKEVENVFNKIKAEMDEDEELRDEV